MLASRLPDMSLADKNTGVMNGLGKALLEYFGLQSSLHESLGAQVEDIIKGVFLVSHQTETLQSSDKRGGLEKALGVLGIQRQKGSGSLSDLREHVLHSPDLTLAAQSVFTAQLELLVKTLLLERSANTTVRLSRYKEGNQS
jgi:hypothetical protein